MNGHIKGYVNGVLEGDFVGVIDGEMGAVVRPKDTVTMERDDAPEENYPRLEAQELPEDEAAGQEGPAGENTVEAAGKDGKISDNSEDRNTEKTAESEGTEDEQ